MSSVESTTSIPSEAPPADEAASKTHAPRRFARFPDYVDTPLKKAVAVATGIGVFVGLITGLLQLRDRVFPPPKSITAVITLSDVVEPDVRWRVGRKHHPELAKKTFTRSQAATLGIVVTAQLQITGEKDKTGTLRWRRVTKDGETLELPTWAPTAVQIRPEYDPDDLRRWVWVPFPVGVEEFLVEFTYLDHRGRARGRPVQSRLLPIG